MTNNVHFDILARRGAADGKAAASWVFGSETSQADFAAVLKGIEDGDPAILNELPFPDFSGQWADSRTLASIVEEELGTASLNEYVLHDGGYALEQLEVAYENAFTQAVQDELTRICQYHLQP